MNDPTTYSVGDARAAFSDILNRVAYRGETVTIEKHGEPVARLVPVLKEESTKTSDMYFGMWKDKSWASRVGKPSRRLNRPSIDI
jgi:prevent-host-death family protein